MAVAKIIAKKGNGTDKPKRGDLVTMDYVGYLYDPSKVSRGYRGKKYAASVHCLEDTADSCCSSPGSILQSGMRGLSQPR